MDFPSDPVVKWKTSPSNAGALGLIPGQRAKIHMPHGQKNRT